MSCLLLSCWSLLMGLISSSSRVPSVGLCCWAGVCLPGEYHCSMSSIVCGSGRPSVSGNSSVSRPAAVDSPPNNKPGNHGSSFACAHVQTICCNCSSADEKRLTVPIDHQFSIIFHRQTRWYICKKGIQQQNDIPPPPLTVVQWGPLWPRLADQWVWLSACCFLLLVYSNHDSKVHNFWARAWDRQLDGPTVCPMAWTDHSITLYRYLRQVRNNVTIKKQCCVAYSVQHCLHGKLV